jgi:hypothetical protein
MPVHAINKGTLTHVAKIKQWLDVGSAHGCKGIAPNNTWKNKTNQFSMTFYTLE